MKTVKEIWFFACFIPSCIAYIFVMLVIELKDAALRKKSIKW
jgi:hypothetical protein